MLLAVPLSIKPPAFVQRFLRFSMVAAGDYFPVTIVSRGKAEQAGMVMVVVLVCVCARPAAA